ncbi:MAG: hypothetical protein JW818_23125 [Pirellulales bacterium]|nr:hypothetical protein [Pirellulales bacterium]
MQREAGLEEKYRLPDFGELEQRSQGPDVRVAWSEAGLAIRLEMTGKKPAAWCRATRPADSDGLHVWIDTRNVQNVHRASRFCHRFFFLPGGQGKGDREPVAGMLPIHRAREPHGPVSAKMLHIRSKHLKDGYILDALIPAAALTGFDPAEHPALGFTYVVLDRELGPQTFGPGSPMPYQEDPSLWATLELVGG